MRSRQVGLETARRDTSDIHLPAEKNGAIGRSWSGLGGCPVWLKLVVASIAYFTQHQTGQLSQTSAFVFKIKKKYFLETYIRKIFFQMMKINNFRREPTDISAKKEALSQT